MLLISLYAGLGYETSSGKAISEGELVGMALREAVRVTPIPQAVRLAIANATMDKSTTFDDF